MRERKKCESLYMRERKNAEAQEKSSIVQKRKNCGSAKNARNNAEAQKRSAKI